VSPARGEIGFCELANCGLGTHWFNYRQSSACDWRVNIREWHCGKHPTNAMPCLWNLS
jgi:hypothetical protein